MLNTVGDTVSTKGQSYNRKIVGIVTFDRKMTSFRQSENIIAL